MDIIIVSGLSGSGKSVALHALEDLGYYCIDNLPAALHSQFLNQFEPMANGHAEHAAIGIDSRNRQFLKSLPNALAHLQKIGQPTRIVFLEATNETLLQRYSETRRKHPLTDLTTPLLGGIAVECTLLAPLEQQADCRINTTHTTPHELRSMICKFAAGNLTGGPISFFQSFGYKHGTPISTPTTFSTYAVFQAPTGYPNSDPHGRRSSDHQLFAEKRKRRRGGATTGA